MFTTDSVQESWLTFKELFLSVLNSVAPEKQVRLKQRSEPWITSDILNLIKLRDKCLYNFKKSKNKDFYTEYCSIRNRVQREVNKAKSDYIESAFEENKSNPRKLWDQLKNLGYSKKTKSTPNVVLKIEDENCFESCKIANHFNSFFTTVASNLVQKLSKAPNLFNYDSHIVKDFYKKRNLESKRFSLHTVSEDFVYKELCKLDCFKSTGLDNIPARFLKDAASFLKIHVIAHLMTLKTDKTADNFCQKHNLANP